VSHDYVALGDEAARVHSTVVAFLKQLCSHDHKRTATARRRPVSQRGKLPKARAAHELSDSCSDSDRDSDQPALKRRADPNDGTTGRGAAALAVASPGRASTMAQPEGTHALRQEQESSSAKGDNDVATAAATAARHDRGSNAAVVAAAAVKPRPFMSRIPDSETSDDDGSGGPAVGEGDAGSGHHSDASAKSQLASDATHVSDSEGSSSSEIHVNGLKKADSSSAEEEESEDQATLATSQPTAATRSRRLRGSRTSSGSRHNEPHQNRQSHRRQASRNVERALREQREKDRELAKMLSSMENVITPPTSDEDNNGIDDRVVVSMTHRAARKTVKPRQSAVQLNSSSASDDDDEEEEEEEEEKDLNFDTGTDTDSDSDKGGERAQPTRLRRRPQKKGKKAGPVQQHKKMRCAFQGSIASEQRASKASEGREKAYSRLVFSCPTCHETADLDAECVACGQRHHSGCMEQGIEEYRKATERKLTSSTRAPDANSNVSDSSNAAKSLEATARLAPSDSKGAAEGQAEAALEDQKHKNSIAAKGNVCGPCLSATCAHCEKGLFDDGLKPKDSL
jgi:hypothetical protein